ncbi:MAG: permease [Subtercola sp.]|nr:permease [Subtercola sp.]
MVIVTTPPPRFLVIGEPEHAVTQYAGRLAQAQPESHGGSPGGDSLGPSAPVHVQFSDRLFGRTPEEAALAFERLARSRTVGVTLHDIPQPSDGRNLLRRAECYRRVIAAARGVACNSRYEVELVARHVLGHRGAIDDIAVIPLPVDTPLAAPSADDRPVRRAEAAVLGYFYPGKGHAEVVAAVAASGLPLAVTTVGRASVGHDEDLRQVVRQARRLGVGFASTGFLATHDLLQRCREAAVPIAAHRHFSASASINTWISAGRRPLVPDAPYTREMAELRPGTLTLYDPQHTAAMAEAIGRAWREPDSTWLAPDATTGPDTAAVAELYRAWWAGLV